VLFAIPVLGIRGYLYGILCSELALSILHSLQILQNNYSNPRK
jgi:stage V sporulation protein B